MQVGILETNFVASPLASEVNVQPHWYAGPWLFTPAAIATFKSLVGHKGFDLAGARDTHPAYARDLA
jgi:hypothetical protein